MMLIVLFAFNVLALVGVLAFVVHSVRQYQESRRRIQEVYDRLALGRNLKP